MDRLLVKNIGVLATPEGRSAKGGKAQGEIRTLRNAWVRIEGEIGRASCRERVSS